MAAGTGKKRFRCYYCDHATYEMSHQVEHLCETHSLMPLKFRSFEFNSQKGQFGYQTKDFEIIPANLPGTIKVDEDTGNVYHDDDSTACVDLQYDVEVLTACIPAVLEEMKAAGHHHTWLNFNKMVSEKQFPLDNLSFLLLMDVCKFLSFANSSSMRYSQKIIQFWRVGYKLFHGKWLRLMGGPKHRGHIVSGQSEKGDFNPSDCDTNFVVPHRAVVSSDSSLISPDDVKPGILT